MITPMIAANWKMNLTVDEGVSLINALKPLISDVEDVEVVVAPSFVSLSEIRKALEGTDIRLAAQNVHWELKGAYTGEISPLMLKDIGCDYVIIGHSERRHIFNENDESINKKLLASLKQGIKPILCVGETLDQRKRGETIKVIERQMIMDLEGVFPSQMNNIVIAYEPVWAIGTGETATPEQAEEVHNFIKEFLIDSFGLDETRGTRVLYGGSVKPENIKGLMAQPHIDGALVGGASLVSESFASIVRFQIT